MISKMIDSRTIYTVERAKQHFNNGEEISIAINHAQYEYDYISKFGIEKLKDMTEEEFSDWLNMKERF